MGRITPNPNPFPPQGGKGFSSYFVAGLTAVVAGVGGVVSSAGLAVVEPGAVAFAGIGAVSAGAAG